MQSRASTSTERTPLVTPRMPDYAFESSLAARYKKRLRSFQCCICVGIIVIFGTALLISASYELDRSNRQLDANNSENVTNETIGALQPNLTLTLLRPRPTSDIATLLTVEWPRPDADQAPWFSTHPSEDAVLEAVEQGTRALAARAAVEAAATPLAGGTAAYRAARAVATAAAADQMAKSGYAAHQATAFLALASSDGTGMDVRVASGHGVGLGPRIATNVPWMSSEYCARADGACPPARYRTADGTCSCPLRPRAGAAFTPFRRALSPEYADGVGAPRGGRFGALPSARAVSALVHRPRRDADSIFTVMLAVWGQFLDHDITATALSRGANGSAIGCCGVESALAHPECFPVLLERGDPYYDQYNLTCMEFVRSAPAPACNFGVRQQFNQATAFIDGSVVYSSDPAVTLKLRSGVGGRLRMARGVDGAQGKGDLLPPSDDPNDGCNREDQAKQGKYCFASGDARANENLHLTTMHLIWARQHNRIADQLHRLNPTWSDEIVFQEARKVLGAQMQHITYNEFLPVVLGSDMMRAADLELQTHGYRGAVRGTRGAMDNHAPPPDPSIANHFAAAAFRFAHTLLPSLMRSVETERGSAAWTHLHEMLFDPFPLYGARGADGRALASAINTRAASVNPHVSPELSNHLFERRSVGVQGRAPCGLDLVSLNIQRGRDHGLPPYPRWRRHCGLREPNTFEDLRGVLDDDSLDRISIIYADVSEVDLYTGALSEVPEAPQLLGATLSCLLADQFARLRRADAYWYETDQRPQAFTPEQLQEIRRTTLAGVLCANADGLPKAQRRVMQYVGPDNPLLPCEELQQLDWRHWQDTPASS